MTNIDLEKIKKHMKGAYKIKQTEGGYTLYERDTYYTDYGGTAEDRWQEYYRPIADYKTLGGAKRRAIKGIEINFSVANLTKEEVENSILMEI